MFAKLTTMRPQTTTAITYGILLFAGAIPLAMPNQLTSSSASTSDRFSDDAGASGDFDSATAPATANTTRSGTVRDLGRSNHASSIASLDLTSTAIPSIIASSYD